MTQIFVLKSIKREMCESVINIAVPLMLEPVEVRSSDPHLAGNTVSSVCGLRLNLVVTSRGFDILGKV